MRAVMLEVPPALLAQRRRLGLDRRDEVWEGVLHMVPPPRCEHGRLNDQLGAFFLLHWEALGLGRSYPETGVKRPGAGFVPELGADVPEDYRTPDRSFLLPGRYDRVQGGWIVGGPDVVLEVVSPNDESREKLPFYRALGVTEVILIDRLTRAVEVLKAAARGFEAVAPDPDGWVRCETLRTELRTEPDPLAGPALHVRRADEPGRELLIRP